MAWLTLCESFAKRARFIHISSTCILLLKQCGAVPSGIRAAGARYHLCADIHNPRAHQGFVCIYRNVFTSCLLHEQDRMARTLLGADAWKKVKATVPASCKGSALCLTVHNPGTSARDAPEDAVRYVDAAHEGAAFQLTFSNKTSLVSPSNRPGSGQFSPEY